MRDTSTIKTSVCVIKPVQGLRCDLDISAWAPTVSEQLAGFIDKVRATHTQTVGGSMTVILHDHFLEGGPSGGLPSSFVFNPATHTIHVLMASQVADFLYGGFDGIPTVDENFHLSMDAQDWAKAFIKINAGTDVASDEGGMIGWFANALMRGFDDGANKVYEKLKIVPPGMESILDGTPLRLLVDVGIVPPTAIFDTRSSEYREWLDEKAKMLNCTYAHKVETND